MVDEVFEAGRAPPAGRGDVIVRPGPLRRISWGGVFAGLFVVLAVQLLLSVLGLGIGLKIVQPGQGGAANAGAIGIGAAVWWVVTYIIALVIGSYTAARLAGVVLRFDGVLHGLVTWAFALMIMLYLLTTAVGGVIGGAFGVVGNAVSAVGQTVKTAAPEIAKTAGITSSGQIRQRAKELLIPTDPSKMTNDQAETLLAEDVGRYLAGGSRAQQARDQIINVMAAKLGIGHDEAAKRFDQWAGQFNEVKSNTAHEAVQVAHRATGVLSRVSISVFVALLLGAIFSCLGGAWGTLPRRSAEEAPLR